MTATPIKNRPVELWPLLRYLDPARWGSRHEFGLRYCNARIGNDGYWDYSGSSNLDELSDILRQTVMIRRAKSDVLEALPPKSHRAVVLEPDGDQHGLIRREHEAVGISDPEAVASMMNRDVELDGALATIRADLAVSKAPAIIDHVEAIFRSGEKCVVFGHTRALVNIMMERWGKQAVKLVGGQTPAQTHRAVQAFQTDPSVMVAVCSIRAAGAGLTLTAAHRVVFGESDWSPAANEQAEDRVHRIGQRHPVTVEYVVLDGSLDRIMHGVTRRKRQAHQKLFETDCKR